MPRYLSQIISSWACSSVVECYVDIVEVASSILAVPTKNLKSKSLIVFNIHHLQLLNKMTFSQKINMAKKIFYFNFFLIKFYKFFIIKIKCIGFILILRNFFLV